MMEPTVRDSLRQLIVRHGQVLCDDPPRCKDLLDKLCGQHKREVNSLISALTQRVPADLLADNAGLPTPQLIARLGRRLEDDLGLTAETAQWAVETWAVALGVLPESLPIAQATAAPPPFEPAMVRIPAGRFLMGSPPGFLQLIGRELERHDCEGPQHWVQVPALELGKHAVTFAEWDACHAAGGCNYKPDDAGWGRGQRPIVEVSWNDRYAGAPTDGSAWREDGCQAHVLRGGSWYNGAAGIRSACRRRNSSGAAFDVGFRVARTLTP